MSEPGDLPIGIERHGDTQWDCWRNRVAGRLANTALRLATPTYRKFITGAILYGMNAAARDALEDAEPPPNWYDHA